MLLWWLTVLFPVLTQLAQADESVRVDVSVRESVSVSASEVVWEDLTHSHSADLDRDGQFRLLWTPREEDIVFEIQAATRGYVGVGFSPNGGMKGADIVTGWVDDLGHTYLQDRHGEGNFLPPVDESQDVALLGGQQNDTHTFIRFSRPWHTCDQHDIQLNDDTTRLIWAMGAEDPKNAHSLSLHQYRGSRSLYLRDPILSIPRFTEDVQSWEILVDNYSVPENQRTMYWCKLFKIPPLRRKNHVIGYEPVIQDGNEDVVHHMVLYECHWPDSHSTHAESWVNGPGEECQSPNMPPSWNACTSMLMVWAIGSEGEIFPENTGFPIGKRYGATDFFMLQTHYDNPYGKKGLVDNSGLRIYHTEKLRQYDAGLLIVGSLVTATQIIPPGRTWDMLGHCTADCTAQQLPGEGVQAFQVMLHSHLLGSQISVTHLREGKQLQDLASDKNYDFNYQQVRVLREEVRLMPGDTLITKCRYDATGLNRTTYGGISTTDEMCLAFIAYYPRVDLSYCASTAPLPTYLQELRIQLQEDQEKTTVKANTKLGKDETKATKNVIQRGKLLKKWFRSVHVKTPTVFQNLTLAEVLDEPGLWSDGEVLERLQDQVLYSPHITLCRALNGSLIPGVSRLTNYPSYLPVQTVDDTLCLNKSLVERRRLAYVTVPQEPPRRIKDSGTETLPLGGTGGGYVALPGVMALIMALALIVL